MKGKSQAPGIAAARKRLRGETEMERFLHRLHCTVLVATGQLSASAVARIYGDTPRAVAKWVVRFGTHGLGGLREEQRSGRPSTLSAAQTGKLARFVGERRAKSQPVTGPLLADFIERSFAVRLTVRQCWRILKKMGRDAPGV